MSDLLSSFWYYSVEMAPGVVTKGTMPAATPLLPRMLLRRADLAGATCLDIGTMEGLIPVLMCRQGAADVVALDAADHNYEKLKAVRAAYGASFRFRTTGLMYDLAGRMGDDHSYDLINLSGLLYHVFSPMQILAGVRPMLRPGGLMIVSTNIVNRDDYTMEFNHDGRLQSELNTFWYFTPPSLESVLRYLKLKPVDALYLPMTPDSKAAREGLKTGYVSVVCRAMGDDDATGGEWAENSRRMSWEYKVLCHHRMMSAQPASAIGYAHEAPGDGLDLYAAVNDPARHVGAVDPRDTHVLQLADRC